MNHANIPTVRGDIWSRDIPTVRGDIWSRYIPTDQLKCRDIPTKCRDIPTRAVEGGMVNLSLSYAVVSEWLTRWS